MTETRPDDPADHAEDFSHRWADRLDQYIAERMVQLGIPPEQIGSSDYERGVLGEPSSPMRGMAAVSPRAEGSASIQACSIPTN